MGNEEWRCWATAQDESRLHFMYQPDSEWVGVASVLGWRLSPTAKQHCLQGVRLRLMVSASSAGVEAKGATSPHEVSSCRYSRVYPCAAWPARQLVV